MKERIVIVFIAVTIGLLITTIGFFLYQQAKVLPQNSLRSVGGAQPTPTPKDTMYLIIEEPENEALTDKRSIQIKGQTNPENTIIVSTNIEDIVATPSSDGNFAITSTIDAGANKLIIKAVAPNGNTKEEVRVVTFSTEEF